MSWVVLLLEEIKKKHLPDPRKSDVPWTASQARTHTHMDLEILPKARVCSGV